jgi:hypothetical protein
MTFYSSALSYRSERQPLMGLHRFCPDDGRSAIQRISEERIDGQR